ncbi:MAG: ABC transporter substrate-binding protein [Chloroflexota bacterium]
MLLAVSIIGVACAPQAPSPKPAEKTAASAPAKPAEAAQPAASTKPGTASKPADSNIAMGAALAGDEAIAKDRSGSGGTLTIAMSAGNVPYPNTPPNEGYEGRRFVGFQIYDGLTRFALDQAEKVPTPKPGLAESWTTSDDKLTWTFKLRQGVKFHDGTPFDAAAAEFAFDRILKKDAEQFDPELFTTNRSNTAMIASYRKVDESTFEIKTSAPYSFLPWDLAFLLIPSPAAVKQYGNTEYIKHAAGTGPYKMTKYVDGQVMELEPNADYWGGKPKLDKLILRPMPDPATRLAALQSGEVQWAEVPPPDSVASLRASGFNVLLKQYPHTILIFLNVQDAPFDNPKVRQALEYAIDRDKMCNDLLNGVCLPAYQFAYEGHDWWGAGFGAAYKYDPEKAKALLKEAGHADGLTINIAYPTGGSGNMWPQPMMELLQANLKAVGVDMKIQPLEWNNILTMFRAGLQTPENKKYNGVYFSHSPLTPPSLFLYASSRVPPAGCCNPMAYKSDKFDEQMKIAQSEFDEAKQNAAMAKAMEIVAEDAPSLFVVHDLNLRVLSPKVRGFIQPQSWFADLSNVWVSK